MKAKASKFETEKYEPSEIEKKWQKRWEEAQIYKPNLDKAQKPFYNLMMFPYPSAEGMHVGNMYAFTGADVYGRFQRMQGKEVFEPIGLDGFGIHSENYAIKVGKHPAEQSKISEKNFYRQLKSIGNSFDWTRTVETYDPSYYKWTQWLFIQLFRAGLAYRKKSPVNFCPSCKTVLADEQVIDGVCERCNSVVEKRDLEQWFFRITKYAGRLLTNIAKLDWSEKVKIAQRNWIGKSEGLIFTAPVKGSNIKIQTFSAHFEAFRADTFVVIAPDHPLLEKLIVDVPNRKEVLDFAKRIVQKRKSEGKVEEKNPEGIFTGKYIIDPVGNGDLPIWVANYAIKEYGTGIVKCSAHDERDFAFAKKYGIRLKPVLFPKDPEHRKRVESLEEYYTDMVNGYLIEPDEFAGKRAGEMRQEVVKYVVRHKLAEPKTQYHLRDWLISRQRYWGPPIPLVFCENCAVKIKNQKSSLRQGFGRQAKIKNGEYSKGEIENPGWITVREKDLPVLLPDIKDWKPKGTGKSPLASIDEFVNTTCPNCYGFAKRETDVSDTFLDSAWYFLRYLATDRDDVPFPSEKLSDSDFNDRAGLAHENFLVRNAKKSSSSDPAKSPASVHNENFVGSPLYAIVRRSKWLPVNMYTGGAEHSVLHLLYSRFITMVLKDLGFIEFEEPFTRFYAHGLLVKEGAKMSKSKGNVVAPDAYIRKFGVDTLRTYLMFMGPFSQGGDFRDSGIEGMHRFLKRIWNLAHTKKDSMKAKNDSNKLCGSNEAYVFMNKTIKRVKDDIENLRYNTVVAALMEYYNFLSKQEYIAIGEFRNLLKLLAPFAPHISEELWEYIGGKFSIHQEPFPEFNQNALRALYRTIAIQINGKLRDTVIVTDQTSKNKNTIEQLARKSAKVKKYLEGITIKKTIYVEGRVINFVTK